jgi:hypothetical protein
VFDRCHAEEPRAVTVEDGHTVKCFHAYDLEGNRDWHGAVIERADRAMKANESAAGAPAGGLQTSSSAAPRRVVERRRRNRSTTEADTSSAMEPWPRGAIAVAVIGAACVALGFFVWGMAIAAAAYFALVRPRQSNRYRADAFFVGALIACVFAGSAVTRHRETRRAAREIRLLGDALRARQKAAGALPKGLTELGWRLYPIFENGRAADPWGRSFLYRAHSDGRTFDLCSLGADGTPSGDDVGQPSRCVTDLGATKSN